MTATNMFALSSSAAIAISPRRVSPAKVGSYNDVAGATHRCMSHEDLAE